MTLLESMMETCVMMDKISAPDGLGGFVYSWVDGAQFDATIIKTSSPEVQVAEMQGASEQYIVVVPNNIPLEFHDVFKRLKDGVTFRVTGYTRDNEAPSASTVQITKVSAERWDIP